MKQMRDIKQSFPNAPDPKDMVLDTPAKYYEALRLQEYQPMLKDDGVQGVWVCKDQTGQVCMLYFRTREDCVAHNPDAEAKQMLDKYR